MSTTADYCKAEVIDFLIHSNRSLGFCDRDDPKTVRGRSNNGPNRNIRRRSGDGPETVRIEKSGDGLETVRRRSGDGLNQSGDGPETVWRRPGDGPR